MTRWLDAAKQATGAGNLPKQPKQPPAPEVNSVNSVLSGGGIPPDAADDALNRYEERAAIREYDGAQARAEAEAATIETARAAGMAPDALQALWAAHPDAEAYLAMLHRSGPQTCGAAASILGWGATRAWQTEARLRAAGLVRYGEFGTAQPTERNAP